MTEELPLTLRLHPTPGKVSSTLQPAHPGSMYLSTNFCSWSSLRPEVHTLVVCPLIKQAGSRSDLRALPLGSSGFPGNMERGLERYWRGETSGKDVPFAPQTSHPLCVFVCVCVCVY